MEIAAVRCVLISHDEVLVEPLRFVGGALQAPTAPGLGVALPEDLERRYLYRDVTVYRILGN